MHLYRRGERWRRPQREMVVAIELFVATQAVELRARVSGVLERQAFAASFWRRGDQHASCVALWWVAQNCGHVATYVAGKLGCSTRSARPAAR